MLDQAFGALKTFDWGTDRAALKPIDEALVATRDNAAARAELESQLAAVLTTDVSRDAKDFVCRALMVIGTASSTATLAGLLLEADNSHMARYALERIPAAEAAAALRDAVGKLDGQLKIGVIGSLGSRKDAASVGTLAALLGDSDAAVARAAATALGNIGTPDAAAALAGAESTAAVIDASFTCAEGLLAAGKKAEALAVYKRFTGADRPKHVRLAATGGILACAGR